MHEIVILDQKTKFSKTQPALWTFDWMNEKNFFQILHDAVQSYKRWISCLIKHKNAFLYIKMLLVSSLNIYFSHKLLFIGKIQKFLPPAASHLSLTDWHLCMDVRPVSVLWSVFTNCTLFFLEMNSTRGSCFNKHRGGISWWRYVNRPNAMGGFQSLKGV